MVDRTRRPWTAEDDMIIATNTVSVAAQLLGRTTGAVTQRRHRTGVVGVRPCVDCGIPVGLTGRSGRPKEFCESCLEKRRPEILAARRATWRRFHHRNKAKRNAEHRVYMLKTKYGVTHEDYELLLAAQAGCCAICSSSDPGPRTRNFHVDHDHETGQVRGLLCGACNLALGKFGDDPFVLRAAASYVERGRLRSVG